MPKVSAIILAAGLSERMGEQNKLFLDLEGKPLIHRVIEKVKASIVDELILVGSELSMDRLTEFDDSGRIRIVENPAYKSGMTSSIKAGVRASAAAGYMICLGDQPKIETATYNLLTNSFKQSSERSIIVPFFEGKKGNPVLFSHRYREAMLAHPESEEGCRSIIQSNSGQIIKVAVEDPGILIDIDTKADYDHYCD